MPFVLSTANRVSHLSLLSNSTPCLNRFTEGSHQLSGRFKPHLFNIACKAAVAMHYANAPGPELQWWIGQHHKSQSEADDRAG